MSKNEIVVNNKLRKSEIFNGFYGSQKHNFSRVLSKVTVRVGDLKVDNLTL
jgi:hypothetical protein